MKVRFRYKSKFKAVSGPMERLEKPSSAYKHIEASGLPRIGDRISQGECIIGKTVNREDESLRMNCGEEAVVHSVFVTTVNSTMHVIVELRVTRNQMSGDKVSPRNSQKCTLSEITREYALPRVTTEGWAPDVYVNSHCIQGRVTISYQLMVKAGTIAARIGNMFSGDPGSFRDVLRYLNSHGNTKYKMSRGLYDILDNLITSGLVYFQSLRHQVLSKIMCRGGGKVHPRTRAPIRGRCHNGGLKFSEMETDAAQATGSCNIARERLVYQADKYDIILCRTCGQNAEFDAAGLVPCTICGSKDLVKTTVPYISQAIINILASR